ncbi:hypothetical protein ROS9278_00701 [Roseomonas sp. CECT 9278]|nr:hypothetical protein ROS9278_00701 [Roseomonas sp. CECT 9278]
MARRVVYSADENRPRQADHYARIGNKNIVFRCENRTILKINVAKLFISWASIKNIVLIFVCVGLNSCAIGAVPNLGPSNNSYILQSASNINENQGITYIINGNRLRIPLSVLGPNARANSLEGVSRQDVVALIILGDALGAESGRTRECWLRAPDWCSDAIHVHFSAHRPPYFIPTLSSPSIFTENIGAGPILFAQYHEINRMITSLFSYRNDSNVLFDGFCSVEYLQQRSPRQNFQGRDRINCRAVRSLDNGLHVMINFQISSIDDIINYLDYASEFIRLTLR